MFSPSTPSPPPPIMPLIRPPASRRNGGDSDGDNDNDSGGLTLPGAIITFVAIAIVLIAVYIAGFYVAAYFMPMGSKKHAAWRAKKHPELQPMVEEALENDYLSPYESWKIGREYDRLEAAEEMAEWAGKEE